MSSCIPVLAGVLAFALVPLRALSDPLEFRPFLDKRFRLPVDIVWERGHYFVVDEKTNSVAVLNPKGGLVRRLGSIGSGRDDLFRPTAAVATASSTLLVHDLGNGRLQEFNADGRGLASITLPKFVSFAVRGKDEILINRPQGSRLVEAFDWAGKRTGSFGDAPGCRDLYGDQCGSTDLPWGELLNRAILATDADGNTYVVFRFAPLVAKFGPNGDQLWEARLKGPLVETLSRRLVENASGARGFIRIAHEGRAFNLVSLDAAFDQAREALMVLLPGFLLIEVGADGVQRRSFKPTASETRPGMRFSPFKLPLAENGEVVLIDIYQPRIYAATVPRLTGPHNHHLGRSKDAPKGDIQ